MQVKRYSPCKAQAVIVATRDPWQSLASSGESPESSGNHASQEFVMWAGQDTFPAQVVQKQGLLLVVTHRPKK